MRSSFYSTKGAFNDQKGSVVQSLKVKNVLELSPQDMQKIEQIREFMKEQAESLNQEIDEVQKLILESSMKTIPVVPSQKELKDYSQKLQDELLQSDQNIKIQKAMNVPKTGDRFNATPGHAPAKTLGATQPLKLPPKGTALKALPPQNPVAQAPVDG